jgi:hypothetical protein
VKYFIDSLPECPVVSELEEVKLFFSNNKKLKNSIDVKG